MNDETLILRVWPASTAVGGGPLSVYEEGVAAAGGEVRRRLDLNAAP